MQYELKIKMKDDLYSEKPRFNISYIPRWILIRFETLVVSFKLTVHSSCEEWYDEYYCLLHKFNSFKTAAIAHNELCTVVSEHNNVFVYT